MESNLTTLFRALAETESPPVIQLQDINHKPVGAIYLDHIKYENMVISETNNTERYFFYSNGIGIYFSFYTKINPQNIV